MTFEQCKIVIFNNIIFMKNIGKFSGKIQWKFSEIFRKNMKFSGQIFRLTSLLWLSHSRHFGALDQHDRVAPWNTYLSIYEIYIAPLQGTTKSPLEAEIV